MQPRLGESVGPWRAFLVTGALYVAPLAVFPYGIPAGVLLAVAAGLLVWWTRSTWVAIACHVTFVASRELVLRVAERGAVADAREFYRLPGAALALLFGTAVLGLFVTWKLQSRWQDHEVRP